MENTNLVDYLVTLPNGKEVLVEANSKADAEEQVKRMQVYMDALKEAKGE